MPFITFYRLCDLQSPVAKVVRSFCHTIGKIRATLHFVFGSGFRSIKAEIRARAL